MNGKIMVRNDSRLSNVDIYTIESMKLLILVYPDKSIKLLYEDKCIIITVYPCTLCSLEYLKGRPYDVCEKFRIVYGRYLCSSFTSNNMNFLNEYKSSLILISKIRNKLKTYETR